MTAEQPIEALQDLLNWSSRLHPWQRHGLRHVARGTLTNENIADTLELCRLEIGLPAGESTLLASPSDSPPNFIPLGKEDLPRKGSALDHVSLVSIEQVRDVNALASDQRLAFKTGLTAIYGNNASGKSGYARILKRACRARERESDLLTNVYDPPESLDAKPRADIHFLVGATPHHLSWIDGGPTSPELPFVQVFDSGCANVQVSEKNDIVFTPLALDLLQRLGDLCEMVKEQLLAEKAQAAASKAQSLDRQRAKLSVGTEAEKAANALSHDTDLKTLRRLGQTSPAESERSKHLERVLSQNPAKLAAHARKRKGTFERLAEEADDAVRLLSHEAITALQRADSDYRSKSEAASIASTKLFESAPLNGVGSATWRALWEAARSFSTSSAYTAAVFPFFGEDAVCVLCQQGIGEAAAKRFAAFDDFVGAETQRAADAARLHLDSLVADLESFRVPRRTRELQFSEDAPELARLRRFFIMTRRRQRAAIRSCRSSSWATPLPNLPDNPSSTLRLATNTLATQIDELERSSIAEERRKLEDEQRELKDRGLLAEILPDLEAELERLKRIHAIDEAIRTTDTKKISHKSTELAKSMVTNRLRDQFVRELQRLGVNHARVELAQAGTSRGTPKFKAQLLANPAASLRRVLSEGEHTCVALAAFLAELAIAHHQSALVFDDPVSSLDHNWRRHVARRLAEESKDRQVIVFTHDTVFLMALMEQAGRLESPISVTHLERRRDNTGIVVEGAPWMTMRVKDRITYLQQKAREAKPHWDKGDALVYEPLARDFYGLLREAWERGVEELLLNQVVLRFGRAVQTTRLKPLVDLTDSDVATVDAAMSKCSTFMRGHDDAPDINETVPDLPELEADMGDFETWVQSMRKRKRS